MEYSVYPKINHVGNANNNNAVLPQYIDAVHNIPIIHRSKKKHVTAGDDVTEKLHRNWRKSLLKPRTNRPDEKRALDYLPFCRADMTKHYVASQGKTEGVTPKILKLVDSNNHLLSVPSHKRLKENQGSFENPLQSSFGYSSSFRKDLQEAYHLLDGKQPEGLNDKIKRNLFNFISTDRQPKLSVYCKCIEKLASRSYTDQSEAASSTNYMTSFLDTAGKLFAQLFGCDIPDDT
ncbi:hypothetical protein BSL78_14991 [Apostichopus japonicus]|uniref:Uncharacterized protein n=1 Tax=Stichopus japonicus TaxID=307972 RepID=A0A2G8KJH1_STIJA|nr:hypothetical protein BSL78_14991 [Apostichopus japonicus]